MSITLSKAPITEAALEVLFEFSSASSTRSFQEYELIVSNKYPKKQSIFQITGNVAQKEHKSVFARKEVGRQLKSADNNSLLQIRQNGVSFSLLNQTYISWNDFKPKALEEVANYISYTSPIACQRYSLRFINSINIPRNSEISDYLKVYPNLGPIKKPVSQYLMRSEIIDESIGAICVLTELLPLNNTESLNIFLDIDVIINVSPPRLLTLDELSLGFDNLRSFKNEIFFESITEKALQNYL